MSSSHSSHKKIFSLKTLLPVLTRKNRTGKKIVFTNGCFDILHVGHVRYLQKARTLGDVLVVGLNADSSVKKIKGAGRPVNSQRARAEVLAALECVDYIVFFSGSTPLELIRAIRPQVLVKGGDWRKDKIVGAALVEAGGGLVRTLPFVPGFSTTRVLGKISKH